MGTVAAGAKIKLTMSIVNGTGGMRLCKMASCEGSFTSTSPLASAAGLYINLAFLNEVSATSANTGQTSTSGGTTTNNIQPMTQVQYRVKTNSTLYVYADVTGNAPQYIRNETKTGGDTVTLYATYTSPNGQTTYASINASNTRWIIYKTRGQMNGVLETLTGTSLNPTAPGGNPTSSNTPTYADTGSTDVSSTPGVAIEFTEWDDEDIAAVLAEMEQISGNNPTEMLNALHKMQFCIGIPPKITEAADPRYMTGLNPKNDFGRCYAELFMMQNTVFSIQPVKVKYLPGWKDDAKAAFIKTAAGYAGGGMDDAEIIAGNGEGLSGKLFQTQSDYNVYINTVNLLARTMSVYLGIGDLRYGSSGPAYKYMDYSLYREKQPKSGEGGILGFLGDTVRGVRRALMDSAINDDSYIHFYTTADGTSMSDSFTVSTKSSGLESLFNNNLSELGSEIQFMLGGTLTNETITALGNAAYDITSGVLGMLPGDAGATLANMVKYGANYLNGGRLVFPQMLDDCTYDRSYACSCRFISPNGTRESIFLNCLLPLCYILPFVMPQMLSDNMYRYPLLAKVDVPSMVHCELAAISNFRIQRGGPDGQSFTSDGLPFEISASFDITPLYSKLMVTNARHPILFLGNEELHEYLGSMCGVTFTGMQTGLKLSIIESLFKSYVPDTFGSMLRSWWDSAFVNAMRNVFNF